MAISLRKMVRNPGAYVRTKGRIVRSIYCNGMKLITLQEARKRSSLLKVILPKEGLGNIEQDKGYLIVRDSNTIDLTQGAIREAKVAIAESEKQSQSKEYLVTITNNDDMSKDSELYKLAIHPAIVRTVGNYLNGVPVLTNISVWYSPNNYRDPPVGSQLYHRDHEDMTQVKCYIHIEDVDETMGPFTLVDASASEIVAKQIRYRMNSESSKRVNDSHFDEYKPIQAVGNQSTIVFVDTSKCFHYGSRGSGRARKLIVFQYLTAQAFVRQSYLEKPKKNKISRMLSHLSNSSDTQLEHFLLNFR